MDDPAGDPVGEAEICAGDDDEADDDSGGLHDLTAIGPLDPLKLAPASTQEPDKPSGCRRTVMRDDLSTGTVLRAEFAELIAISHVLPRRRLARLAVRGMPLAPLAVLAKLQPLRVVALALIRLVVAALALLAGEGGSDPNVSTGHVSSPRKLLERML